MEFDVTHRQPVAQYTLSHKSSVQFETEGNGQNEVVDPKDRSEVKL